MGETEKPFACTSEGCHMSFTNEDHLNIHQKKHDMVLNLGLINKNSSIPGILYITIKFVSEIWQSAL